MDFRNHSKTRDIDWNGLPWVRTGGRPQPDMNDARLSAVREREEGIRIEANHSSYGDDPMSTLLLFEDADFEAHIKDWLEKRRGYRLEDIYDDDLEWEG